MKHIRLQTSKQSELQKDLQRERLEVEKSGKSIQEKKFYETPWFWICITVIVMCLTRPFKIVICGNGNGNTLDQK